MRKSIQFNPEANEAAIHIVQSFDISVSWSGGESVLSVSLTGDRLSREVIPRRASNLANSIQRGSHTCFRKASCIVLVPLQSICVTLALDKRVDIMSVRSLGMMPLTINSKDGRLRIVNSVG
jgi:hypothetical protein